MRFLLLALAFSSAASAQSDKLYSVYASQADLENGSTLVDVVPTCLAVSGGRSAFVTPPRVYFVDRTSGALAVYDPEGDPGARTLVVATAEELAAAAGAPVTGCVDAEATVVFRLDVAAREVFLVLDTPGGSVVLRYVNNGTLVRLTDPASPTDAGRGVTGLAYGSVDVSGQPSIPVVFLARSRAAGAPESGVYTVDAEAPDQSPAAFALDAAADLVGIAYLGFQRLRVVSSDGGAGDFRNALLGVANSALVPTEQPCEGAPCGAALGALATDYLADTDIFVPYSLVFDRGANGADDRILAVRDSGVPAEVVFTSSGLVAATGIAGFAPAGRNGYLDVLRSETSMSRSTILVAGSDEAGATPGIYGAAALLSVNGETGYTPGAAVSVGVWPNPVAGRGTVSVSVPAPTSADVSVYDVLGRRVAVLHDGPLAGGSHGLPFETAALAPGVYAVHVRLSPDVGSARTEVRRVTVR